jgi:hypothetical protein
MSDMQSCCLNCTCGCQTRLQERYDNLESQLALAREGLEAYRRIVEISDIMANAVESEDDLALTKATENYRVVRLAALDGKAGEGR